MGWKPSTHSSHACRTAHPLGATRPSSPQTIFVTTLAEAPGLLAAAALIDGKGRKWTLRAGLGVCAAALAALAADLPRGGQLALLFAARACIEGTFSVLYVYTPEVGRRAWWGTREGGEMPGHSMACMLRHLAIPSSLGP